MAGTFPDIQYAKTEPSGRALSVPANIDVSTGADYIAQGIANLGGAFEKIADIQDATELSTAKRRMDETSYNYLNKYSTTGDETERKKLAEQWNKEIDGISGSIKSSRVRREFDIHKNNTMPHWGQTFANKEAIIREQQIEDATKINIEKKIANGDIEGAAVDYWNLHKLKPAKFSKAFVEKQITELPTESALAQARILTETQPFIAMKQLEDIKDLSPDQLQKKDQIARIITQQQNYYRSNFEAGINERMLQIDLNEDMSPEQFEIAAEGLKAGVINSLLDGDQKLKLVKELDKWKTGTAEIDYDRTLSLNQEIDAAYRTGIVDPSIEDRINRANLEGAFGSRKKGGAKTYSDMIRRFKNIKLDTRIKAVEPIVNQFERENSDEPELVFLFHQAKNKLIEDNPDSDIKDIFVKISGLVSVYESKTPKQIEGMMKENMVRVISPDGKRGYVKQEEIEQAIKEGYRKIE